MNKFIREHLRYPAAALQAGVEGKVRVRYSVDYRGVVVDTQIKSGIGHGCDEEAERVVQLLRFEVPQDRKRKVRIHQDIDINFQIQRKQRRSTPPKSAAPAIRYHFQPTPKPAQESEQPPDKPAKGYTYTIRFN